MESVIRLAVAGSRRRWFVAVLAAVITAALVILVGVPGATVAAAPVAPTVLQCNPAQSFPGTTAGWEVTCNVTIENSIIGGTSSTITATACLTAAGVIPTPADCEASPGYYKTVTTSSQLVTSVNQCNYTATGGGSNVFCDVTVINDIPAGTPTSGVTVNQCNNAATTIERCDPYPASTSGATVTQCNGSGGKGTYVGTYSVQCTVTGAASALPVTINQCNNTATGGGSSVTCTATITNNFVTTTGPTTTIATGPTTTTTTGPTTTTTTGPTTTTTTTTTAPTTTTAAAGSGSSGTAGGSSSGTAATLAFTGAHLTATILAGLLAIILGVMMLLAARRRATDEDFRR